MNVQALVAFLNVVLWFCVTAYVADRKGRSFLGWGISGALFSFIPLLILWLFMGKVVSKDAPVTGLTLK